MATKEYLTSHGIKASAQRIAIMDYLLAHKTHPTVGEIYDALNPSMPSLSKTTLYNTLKLFVEKKVATQVGIDEKNARFDGDVSQHAHFQCYSCERIYDIFPDELPELNAIYRTRIGNMRVVNTELLYHGYCDACAKVLNNSEAGN